MLPKLSSKYLRITRFLNPTVWTARLLGGFRPKKRDNGPGLLLIQIDALGWEQFTHALHENNLPFLGKLIASEHYKPYHHYSGLPSTTPAVQAELLYGVKTAVPSFGYRDSETGRLTSMLNPVTARQVQNRLAEKGESLLREGSSYSNVYAAGAERSAFCFSKFGFGNIVKRLRPLEFGIVVLLNAAMFFRAAILIVVETVLAVFDFARGLVQGRDLLQELQFVPSRVALCVVLRELTTTAAMIDILLGRRIIHVNFIGYDEQAHRRGPSSRFAHWTLRGIDDCIRRLWKVAHRIAPRDYDIWIYSDHGQEEVIPYERMHGKHVRESIQSILDRHLDQHQSRLRVQSESIRNRRTGLLRMRANGKSRDTGTFRNHHVLSLSGYGPIGHLYLHLNESESHRHRIASSLVKEAGIPLVMFPKSKTEVWAYTERGHFLLPEQIEEVLGTEHPFLLEAAQDIIPMVVHPDAGDFVLSGWTKDGQSITFPLENGAHGGPGSHETHGFALLPASVGIESSKGYLRPLDIRQAIQEYLYGAKPHTSGRTLNGSQSFRVMSYNMHSCIGFDGRCEPERHARIIGHYHPDIVALQEVDVGKRRSGGEHQAQRIASILDMEYHFHPCTTIEEEHYGIAVISRFPIRLVKAGALPRITDQEARGAMWVEIDRDGKPLQIVNTHLSLVPRERLFQAETIMGPKWVGAAKSTGNPVVLCGDFNMMPRSRVYQTVAKGLEDTTETAVNKGETRTWMGVAKIDYVFVSNGVEVDRAFTPRTVLTRKASDHTPLVVDLRVEQRERKEHAKWISGNGFRTHSPRPIR